MGATIGGRRRRQVRSRFVLIGIALLLSGASLIPVLVAPSLLTAMISVSCGVGFGFITGGIW